jgi:hypothetical protein
MFGFSFREIFSNIIGSLVADAVTPGGMTAYAITIGTLVWIAISWHRHQRAAKKPGMAGLPFIILCMAVALLAVGGATYGLTLRSMSASTSENPSNRKFYAADINARIQAIDRLDAILVRFQPIVMQSQEFWNRIQTMIEDRTAPDLLLKYANDVRPIMADLDSAMFDYRTRFPELAQAITAPDRDYSNVLSLYSTSLNLRDEIFKWVGQPNEWATIQNTRTYVEWDRAIRSVQPWLDGARQNLIRLRQQYASADVYETGQNK